MHVCVCAVDGCVKSVCAGGVFVLVWMSHHARAFVRIDIIFTRHNSDRIST